MHESVYFFSYKVIKYRLQIASNMCWVRHKFVAVLKKNVKNKKKIIKKFNFWKKKLHEFRIFLAVKNQPQKIVGVLYIETASFFMFLSWKIENLHSLCRFTCPVLHATVGML